MTGWLSLDISCNNFPSLIAKGSPDMFVETRVHFLRPYCFCEICKLAYYWQLMKSALHDHIYIIIWFLIITVKSRIYFCLLCFKIFCASDFVTYFLFFWFLPKILCAHILLTGTLFTYSAGHLTINYGFFVDHSSSLEIVKQPRESTSLFAWVQQRALDNRWERESGRWVAVSRLQLSLVWIAASSCGVSPSE